MNKETMFSKFISYLSSYKPSVEDMVMDKEIIDLSECIVDEFDRPNFKRYWEKELSELMSFTSKKPYSLSVNKNSAVDFNNPHKVDKHTVIDMDGLRTDNLVDKNITTDIPTITENIINDYGIW